MLTLTKFICGCLGVAAVALLGMSLLQPSSLGARSNAQVSSSSTSDALLQSAVAQADSIYRQAAVEAGPQLRSFYITGSAFVRANASSASLQLQGMGNGLSSSLSIDALRHGNAPYWMRNGIAGVEQASGEKTLAAAKAMPISKVFQSNLERLADAHPSLSAAASGF
jgi:hypothetical protein